MNQAIERVHPGSSGALAAQVVLDGDLSGLSDQQLSTYYIEMCRSLDLNHLTRPFSLLKLNGKLIWYANKDCSDQLRKRDRVSVSIVSREEVAGVLIVTARATMPDGRTDESVGALPIDKLSGEARANALMKCETKAKRRVTLSICGLGMLDESEIEGAQATEDPPHLSPHTPIDEAPNAGRSEDAATFMKRMTGILEKLKSDIAYCKSYDEMVQLRALCGSKAKPGDLNRQMQDYGPDRRIISGAQFKDLSKIWQHCDRQLAALEAKLKPPPIEASFQDEPEDDTEAFGAKEREPGEDDD